MEDLHRNFERIAENQKLKAELDKLTREQLIAFCLHQQNKLINVRFKVRTLKEGLEKVKPAIDYLFSLCNHQKETIKDLIRQQKPH